MDINLDRVLGRLEELYQCGAQEDGTFTRMAYSPEDRKGRETLIESGRKLRHPLEIVVFTDEEGFRFGSGMLGSGAMCGQDLHVSEEDQDMYGQARGDVLKACG